MLINPPILAFPDFNKEFYLTTDASGSGLGGVLSQIDENGDEKPIGYASRGLTDAEKNYSATELEACAVVWAIDYFRHYLYGHKFIILSDHNPLVYMENTKNKTSKVNRWRLELAEYNYEIRYKAGILNTNADALSRVNESHKAEKVLVNTVEAVEDKFKADLRIAQSMDEDIKKLLGSKSLGLCKGG